MEGYTFEAETVPLAEVRPAGPQCRAGLSEPHLKALEAAHRDGTQLDRVKLVKVAEGDYIPVDGWHRLELYSRLGLEFVEAEVACGTEADADWLASGANKEHLGLPRDRGDVARAVDLALRTRPTLADNAIARHVGCHQSTVSRRRRELEGRAVDPLPAAPVRTDRQGRQVAVPAVSAEEAAGAYAAAEHAETGRRSAAARAGAKARQALADPRGVEVPEPLRGAFADTALADMAELFAGLAASINPDALARRLGELTAVYRFVIARADGRPHLAERFGAVKDELEEIASCLRAGVPAAVCPRCAGAASGCDGCRGTGLVPEWRLNELEGRAA